MTKHPQSTLGYAVDGVVVFMPRRRPVEPGTGPKQDHKNHGPKGRNQRKKQLRRQAKSTSDVKQRYAVFNSTKEIRELQKSTPAIADIMENLKNASKTGNAFAAHNCAAALAGVKVNSWYPAGVRFASVFFLPTIENREAVYYAAHSGQNKLLRIYFATWIVAKTLNHSIQANRTILRWFQAVGFPSTYDKSRFQQTIINALSKDSEVLMKREHYTLNDLKRIVKASSCFENTLQAFCVLVNEKKKKRLPRLMHDRFESTDDPLSDYFSDSAETTHAHHSETTCSDYNVTGNAEAIAHQDSKDRDGNPIGDEMPCLKFDDFEYLGVTKTDNADESVDTEDWLAVSNRLFEGEEHSMNRQLQEQEEETATCDWSVLSDVSSVRSIGSTNSLQQRTYADILKVNGTGPKCRKGSGKTSMPTRRVYEDGRAGQAEYGEETNDAADQFDAFFIRDGVKQGRAGKARLQYKGNQRTQKR